MMNCDREYLPYRDQDFCKTHQKFYIHCVLAELARLELQNQELQKIVDQHNIDCIAPDKEELFAEVCALRRKETELNRLNSELVEKCAKIADSEPWPEGPAPSMVILASAGLSYEKIVEATVKATRESIARKIRQQTEKPAHPVPNDPNRCFCAGTEHCRWCGNEPCTCERKRTGDDRLK